MPRKIPTQVDQSLSRALKGGYLKYAPVSYPTLLAYPPNPLPARAPFQNVPGDIPSSTSKTSLDDITENVRRNRFNSAKKARSQMPKLFPQPIVYLADRIRERFYQDHPWEAFRPRTLVEGATLQELQHPKGDTADFKDWGRNPGPEDVIAFTIHLHKKHSLSLSQAYHHTLSSYHALRAEHEHATRSAILEARSYGAVFATTVDGEETSAVEIERGYQKEERELKKGAEYFQKTYGMAGNTAGVLSTVTDNKTGAIRVKVATPRFSRGQLYLKAALEARDGVKTERTIVSRTAEGQEEENETVSADKEAASDAVPPVEEREAIQVGRLREQSR